jgi:hypothetical protein
MRKAGSNHQPVCVLWEDLGASFLSISHLHARRKPPPKFEHPGQLIDLVEEIIARECTEEDHLAILNAHPRIGAPKTNMSAMSRSEQSHTSRSQQSNKKMAEKKGEKMRGKEEKGEQNCDLVASFFS